MLNAAMTSTSFPLRFVVISIAQLAVLKRSKNINATRRSFDYVTSRFLPTEDDLPVEQVRYVPEHTGGTVHFACRTYRQRSRPNVWTCKKLPKQGTNWPSPHVLTQSVFAQVISDSCTNATTIVSLLRCILCGLTNAAGAMLYCQSAGNYRKILCGLMKLRQINKL